MVITSLKQYRLWFIMALAAFLRVQASTDRDFWLDEAFTGLVIQHDVATLLGIVARDFHPPLYFLLVKLFAAPFHYSVFGIRLFSIVMGTLGVGAVFLLARAFAGEQAGLYASLITALSPFAVQYAGEARMYSLFAMLMTLSAYCLIRGLQIHRLVWYLAWGVCYGLALLTHFMALVYAPLFVAVCLVWRLRKRGGVRWRTQYWHIGFGYTTALLCLSPWLPVMQAKLSAGESPHWVLPARLADLVEMIHIFFIGSPAGMLGMPLSNTVHWFPPWLMATVALSAAVLAIGSALHSDWRKGAFITLFLLGPLIGVYLLQCVDINLMVARYLIPSAYILYTGFGAALQRAKKLVAVFVVTGYALMIALIVHPDYPMGYSLLTRELDRYGGVTFYTLTEFDYLVASYYLGPERVVLYNIRNPFSASDWLVMGSPVRRAYTFEDVYNDPQAVIIVDSRFIESSERALPIRGFREAAVYHHLRLYAVHTFSNTHSPSLAAQQPF